MSLTSLQKVGIITNVATNLANTAVNVHHGFGHQPAGGGNVGGGSVVHHHHERQLTPEEIKMLQEQHQENLERQKLERSIAMNEYADRMIEKSQFLRPDDKPSNVPYFIIGGCFVLGVFFLMIKPKK